MQSRFPTADEILSLALFFMSGHGTEILLDPEDDLDAPQDVRAWLSLPKARQDYGVAPDVILAGLQSHAARGAIRLAQGDQGEVYVELRRDVRHDPGYQPWTIRQGVRMLLEGKSATPAPLRLA